ncbi:MAG: hypothetical protein JNN27_07330 [Planctomycetes bacterium]|nr:hypothetical protein [Planctomycetota bacterium]
MNRHTHPVHYLAALVALPAAVAAAWRAGSGSLGDPRAVGVLLGVGLALAVSLAGWAAQERSMRKNARSANGVMTAFALAFLVKLFVLALGAVVLRLEDSLGALADWRAYLVGFAAAVAWVLFVGAFRRSGAARAPKEAPASC